MAAAHAPERIVLVGPPERLTGIVRLSNPGTEKLKVKAAPMRLKSGAVSSLGLAARLAAGATQHAEATVELDPRTPPGEHHAVTTIAGQPRDVVLKVLERRAVAVAPARFEIHGAPGGSAKVPAVVTNLGNVPFELPRVALVALGQAGAFGQLFHVAMARKGAEGHQAALDTFAQLLAASEVEAPKAVFGNGAGRTLAPGDSVETEITFELPANLARHRLYRGSFTIGRATCIIEIEVAPAKENPR